MLEIATGLKSDLQRKRGREAQNMIFILNITYTCAQLVCNAVLGHIMREKCINWVKYREKHSFPVIFGSTGTPV